MTEPRLLLSPRAEADLVDIGEYIGADNPVRARTFILELRDFLSKIAASPFMGRPRAELRKGLRSIPLVGYSYTIYYRVLPRRSGIKVERVLHGARDVSRIF
jgi:toxin ParE1/3/4